MLERVLHLDDPDASVQEAVFRTLSVASSLRPSLLVEKAQEYRAKHRSPSYCDRLVAFAKSKTSASSPMDIVDTSDLDDIDE